MQGRKRCTGGGICEDGIEITRSEHVLYLEPGERKAGEGACYSNIVKSLN